jgi:cytochrome c biogenesis protein CcmG/thiol:disulfide interchange protein DsbE
VNRLLLFFVLVLWNVGSYAALPVGLMKKPGQLAPELKLSDPDLGPFDLAKQRGHWVMVHFWASWCGPCRRELPKIQTMSKQIDKKKLKLVMINTAETDDDIFVFLSTVAPDLQSYRDSDGSITDRWQPRGLPSSFLVDPDGRIQYLALGGRPWDKKEYVDFLKGLYAR